ncbi:MAG: class I SAM-dependent methyltransferase, partial [Syntrophothermus sp.]
LYCSEENRGISLMDIGFDKSALSYDETFTHSSIGVYLRKRVHSYLDKKFPADRSLKILELNCGTGEDAIYFAKHGHFVTATDSSAKMLEAAKRKTRAASLDRGVKFVQLDINDLKHAEFSETFDLVFSDFGGLNCIPPERLKELSVNIKNVLSANGRFIAVAMSKYCQWEIAYFLLRGKIKNAFRRLGNRGIDVSMNGTVIKTYYYTPADIRKIFESEFSYMKMAPVGLFIPPPYLESFFRRRTPLLSFFNKLESLFGGWSWPAALGDHFLIDLKVKR